MPDIDPAPLADAADSTSIRRHASIDADFDIRLLLLPKCMVLTAFYSPDSFISFRAMSRRLFQKPSLFTAQICPPEDIG